MPRQDVTEKSQQEETGHEQRDQEINRITTAIIRISMKLIVYALIILLLYEGCHPKDTPLGARFFTAEASGGGARACFMTVTIGTRHLRERGHCNLADDGLIASRLRSFSEQVLRL